MHRYLPVLNLRLARFAPPARVCPSLPAHTTPCTGAAGFIALALDEQYTFRPRTPLRHPKPARPPARLCPLARLSRPSLLALEAYKRSRAE